MAFLNKMMGDAVNYGAPLAPRMSRKEQQLRLQQEQEEREKKIRRDAQFQGGQDKYSRLANPVLDYASGVAKDRRENGALSQNVTAYGVGEGVSDGVQYLQANPSLGALGRSRNLVGLAEGATNFGRGVLGIEGETDFFDPIKARLDQSSIPESGVVNPPMSQGISDRLRAETGTGALTQYGLNANQLPERNMDTGALEQLGEAPYEHLLPKQTHVMPDGTVMEGAEHSDDSGVLSTDITDTSVSTEPYVAATGTGNSKKDGILSSIGEAASVDRSGTATGNKRDATGLSVPRQKIDMSEMLMRVGGAISGSAADGALASINSGTNTWGAIQDENRAMEMQQYEADQAAYENEENRKVQRMTSGRLNAAAQTDAIEKRESFSKRNQRIGSLDMLIDDLTAAGDNVTGLWDGTGRALLDRATGDRNANLRLRLEDQRVDAALTKVEQTKGAISNREMDLFLSPMPKLTDSEEVWIDWMTMQRNVAAKMNQVASGGFDSTGTRYLNAVDEDAPLSPELEAYLAKYPPK